MIVIENKIESDINSIRTDENNSTQLRRYYNYVSWLIENIEIKPHFLILTPNYNIPHIEEERNDNNEVLDLQMSDIYKIITYKDLYDFFSKR